MAVSFIGRLREYGENIALIWRDSTFSYGWLAERIDYYRNKVDACQEKIFSLHSDYTPNAIAFFLALYESRKVIVPIAVSRENEVLQRLKTAEVQATVSFRGDELSIESLGGSTRNPLLSGLVEAGRSGLVLFSSGSTGMPKAMIHDLENLIEAHNDRKPKNVSMLIFLLFDHIGGLNTLFSALSMGATIVIPEERNPEQICHLVEKHKVQVLPATPSFLNLLLLSDGCKKNDLSSLRMITYGTEPMPVHLLKRLKGVFARVKFLQTFGTSETGIINTRSQSSESIYMKLDDPNASWKIIDGELWVKSKTHILGYVNCADPFREDGWFPTGDLVELTDEGYLKITGRTKEVINVGGRKVLPQEVEEAILEVEGVSDAAVCGECNLLIGQIVAASVVIEEGSDSTEMTSAIRRHCKERLESYKMPVKIHIVKALDYGERFKKKRMMNGGTQ